MQKRDDQMKEVKFLEKEAFVERHQRIRQFLEAEGYQAFAILTSDNFYYASGFFLDVAPWERPVALVIPRDGEPFAVMNELSTHHVRMAKERGSLAVADTCFWNEHPSSTLRTYTRPQWTELLAAQLKARGIDRGTIACDSSFSAIEPVTKVLPKLDFVIEAQLLKDMRMVKSEAELHFIREGAKLTDFGQEVWGSLIAPGKLMAEVDAETTRQMVVKGAEMFPGNKVDVWVFSLSGPASASPHGTGGDSDMTIAAGHGIVNIIIVRLNGYVIENERTWMVGEPSDLQARAFAAAEGATVAATKQMVAGNLVLDLANTLGTGRVTVLASRDTSGPMTLPSTTGPCWLGRSGPPSQVSTYTVLAGSGTMIQSSSVGMSQRLSPCGPRAWRISRSKCKALMPRRARCTRRALSLLQGQHYSLCGYLHWLSSRAVLLSHPQWQAP